MKKFEPQGVIGIGAYGIVLKAQNKETNEIVAIKKFKESDQDETIRKISLREVKILKLLSHPNIVHQKESFRRKEKLHQVFEYVERTALEVLEKTPTGIAQNLIRLYCFQTQKAVLYLHEQNIIHRDIKPENLLVNSDNTLKICDFGFARKIHDDPNQRLTDYVATRWYRSPELLLTDRYGKPSDIWAIGCIMGELTDGKPQFPGKDQIDQLHLTMKIQGPLTPDLKDLMEKNPDYRGASFKDIKNFMTIEGRYKGKMNKEAMSFLKGSLSMSPKNRLTAEEALCHPYFRDLRENDPDLLELSRVFEGGRLGGINIEVCELDDNDKRLTRNGFSNKIRIKNYNEQRFVDKKQNSFAPSTEDSKGSKINNNIKKYTDESVGVTSISSPKTIYNMLEKQQNNFEDSKYYNQNLWKKKNQPAHTQLAFHNFHGKLDKSKANDLEINLRQKIGSQIKGSVHNNSNTSRLKFDHMANGTQTFQKHNTGNSYSQLNKKYNFTIASKFNSQERKPKVTHSHQFNGFGTINNAFNNYENLYGTNSIIKQQPTQSNKKFYTTNMNSDRENNNMNVKSYNKFQPQTIKKSSTIEQHTIIRRKAQTKALNTSSQGYNMNSQNYSTNNFEMSSAPKKFF